MTSFESREIDRRTFLLAGFAVAMRPAAQATSLETLTQWLNASRAARANALQPCVDRIRAMDSTIHGWVQVLPQKPTGNGRPSEIPFGVKDIIETRGFATEYGSPITRDESALPTPRLFARCGNAEQSCWERLSASLRVPHTRTNAQPTRFGAHTLSAEAGASKTD
jgi:hypothetical protein